MAKKLSASKFAGLPVRTLRRLVGIPAHRASTFNACIGAELKGKKYSQPPKGTGGQQDKRIQAAFTGAVDKCKSRH